MNKTNVIRLLEANRIPHDIKTYAVNEDDLSGTSVAQKIGAAEEIVFKTLVVEGDKTGIIVFCIPVNSELNLKKAATVSGNKKVELIPTKNLLAVTGYVRGGCSPIGMKKKFPTFLDETAQLFDKIYFSAGIRGMQVGVHPDALQMFTGSVFVDLT
jgi:Cys-tRNA(Pro)/Cys-tRNA(Cys) deacylase